MNIGIMSTTPSRNVSCREEDPAEIEETLSSSIDFLSVESTVQNHRAHHAEISTATETLPYSVESSKEKEAEHTNQGIGQNADSTVTVANAGHDGDLILCPEQLTLLDELRRTLRSCEIDADRFQVCVRWRDYALSKDTQFQYFVAEMDTIMFEECKEYERKKLEVCSEQKDSERDAEWGQFVGVVREGDAIRKCLAPLRRVSIRWGKEKVQHYNWACRGEKYCKSLGTAVSTVSDWSEAVCKLNQLMKRRMVMSGRRAIQVSVNPIDQIDLENLKKWPRKDPYIKMNDREEVQLEYRELTVDDLPEGYGFDEYGLIVRSEFAVTVGMSPSNENGHHAALARRSESSAPMNPTADSSHARESENLQLTSTELLEDTTPQIFKSTEVVDLNLATVDEDFTTRRRFDTDQQTVLPDVERMTPTIIEIPSSTASSILSSPPSSAVSDITSPTTSEVAVSPFEEEAANQFNVHSKDILASGAEQQPRTSNRIPSTQKPSYHGQSKPRSHTRSRRHTATRSSNSEAPGIQCHCSTELPEAFLQFLERDSDTVSYGANLILLQQLAEYEDTLCLQHLKRLTKRALAAIPYTGTTSLEADMMSDLPPAKRRRLTTSTFSAAGVEDANVQDQATPSLVLEDEMNGRPLHNSAGDSQFRQLVLDQLTERITLESSKPTTWGESSDLLWSSLEVWMGIILNQLRYPEITNEEIRAAAPKYVDVVTKLASQRQSYSRVVELGGEERAARFFALCEVRAHECLKNHAKANH